MGRIYTFLLGMVIGIGLYHAALHYHVVNAQDGLHVIPKSPPRLAEMYVDVRKFDLTDWKNHAQLVIAIEKSGQRQILTGAAAQAVDNAIDKVLPPAK